MREEQRLKASAKGNREKRKQKGERENFKEARRDKKKRIWEMREWNATEKCWRGTWMESKLWSKSKWRCLLHFRKRVEDMVKGTRKENGRSEIQVCRYGTSLRKIKGK